MSNVNQVVICIIILAISVYMASKWNANHIFRDELDDNYGYIIVGAGAAGNVLANRLSEIATEKILLVEAGDDDQKYPDVSVPILAGSLWGNADLDWFYLTVPQKNACKSARNNQCGYPRGKLLGGSSSINCLVYGRGSPEDYNHWANGLGCEGWSYEDVLPYFIKAESNQNPYLVKSGYHGDKGPLYVSDVNTTIIGETFLKAGIELGYQVGDNNGKEGAGVFSRGQATSYNGLRMSTAEAYLRPAMHRSNLHVMVKSHVTQIIFEGKRAVGVKYMHDGKMHTVRASKEVILSGGTFGSAHILLLSGVGPKLHLEEMGIPVIADLPVGENLQDTMIVLLPGATITEPVSITGSAVTSLKERFEHALFGTGMRAAGCANFGDAFVMSANQPKEHAFPYTGVLGTDALLVGNFGKCKNYGVSKNQPPERCMESYGDIDGEHGFHLSATLLHPNKYGSVRLQSLNPFEYPLIDPNYLSSDQDIKVFIDGIRLGQRITNTKAFKTLGTQVKNHQDPSCSMHGYDTDMYWECFLRRNAGPLSHPTGTCRMGAKNDPNSVVDTDLKVKGLEGLRVIDASVMPQVPSGAAMAPTIMIAEKASDIIKKTIQNN